MSNRWMAGFGALVLTLGLVLAPAALAQTAERAARPHLGIFAEPTAPNAEQAGVRVAQVEPNSPAAKAGLKTGDLITKVGDQEVKNMDALVKAVNSHKPGDKLTFHVSREGKDQEVAVTLGERPRRGFAGPGEAPAARQHAFLGVQTQELSADLKNQLGVAADKGAVVTDVMPNTPAAKAGLKQEDVITGVDDKSVANPGDLRDAIGAAETGKEVTLHVVRGKEKMDVKAKLEAAPAGFGGGLPAEIERNFPGIGRGFPGGEVPGVFGSPQRVRELEAKVKDLEKRVRDLEQKLGQQSK